MKGYNGTMGPIYQNCPREKLVMLPIATNHSTVLFFQSYEIKSELCLVYMGKRPVLIKEVHWGRFMKSVLKCIYFNNSMHLGHLCAISHALTIYGGEIIIQLFLV